MLRGAGLVVLLVASLLVPTSRAEAALADYVYLTSTPIPLPAGALRVKQKLNCPKGTAVTGGGARALGTISSVLVTSSPFDSRKDRDRKPDDGWLGVMSNPGTATDNTMLTFAICAKVGSYRYVSKATTVPAGTTHGVVAFCPTTSRVTGGGVSLSGTDANIEVGGSAPIDSPGDTDSARDDGFVGRMNNGSGSAKTVRAWAICESTKSYTYLTLGNPFSNTTFDTSQICPGGQITTGGGSYWVEGHLGAEILALYPNSNNDFRSTVRISSPSATLEHTTVCTVP